MEGRLEREGTKKNKRRNQELREGIGLKKQGSLRRDVRRTRAEKGRTKGREKGLERKIEGEPRQKDRGYHVQRQGIMKGSSAERGKRRKGQGVLHTHK